MTGTSSYTGTLPMIGFFIVRVTYVGAEPMTVRGFSDGLLYILYLSKSKEKRGNSITHRRSHPLKNVEFRDTEDG